MNTRRGWTLLELMAVLAIFAVLLSIMIPILRNALAKSQSAKNLANMSLTARDFFMWSNQHNGRMVNAGLPGEGSPGFYGNSNMSIGSQTGSYLAISQAWPRLLKYDFGDASPHWQSTYSDPTMGGEDDVESIRRSNPDWVWTIPSLFTYSSAMFMKSTAFPYPGLGLTSYEEIVEYYGYVSDSDIANPSGKGLLLHLTPAAANTGPTRQIAFSDGSVSERIWADARPSGVHPFSADTTRRSGAVLYTENGFLGSDY